MPEFALSISDKTLEGLQVEVTRHNANNGTFLSVLEWIDLHLKDIVIAPALASFSEELRKEAEQKAKDLLLASLRAERDRLLQEL